MAYCLAYLPGGNVYSTPSIVEADCRPAAPASWEDCNKDMAFDSVLQVTGDSMINAFIPRHTFLLVKRTTATQNGDIIIASVNCKLLVRFFKQNDHKRWLVPANSKYPDIEITPEMSFEIFGVVKQIISPTGNLRQYMR